MGVQAEFKKGLQEKRSPVVLEVSSPRAMSVAQDLKRIGAKMYGAYWCGHCYNQKGTLGKEAMSLLAYVECDASGYDNKNKLCESKKVEGYPTWEINGKFYSGEQSLDSLERYSKIPRR